MLYHAFNRTAHEAQRCEPMPVCQWIEYRREKLGIDTAGNNLQRREGCGE